MYSISFRRLAADDLPLLHRWLNEPEVVIWYAKQPPSAEDVAAKYLPRIDGVVPVNVHISAIDGTEAGLIQAYLLRSFPEYAAAVQGNPDWMGIDFFIAEPRFRSRGLGARIIDEFVSQFVFGAGHATCCSSPAVGNERSIRTLLRAGFHRVRPVHLQSGAVEQLMVRHDSVAA